MKNFKLLFCERFFIKIVEIVSISIDVKLQKLKQRFDEFLIVFYKRVFDFILKSFIREITNSEIRKKNDSWNDHNWSILENDLSADKRN